MRDQQPTGSRGSSRNLVFVGEKRLRDKPCGLSSLIQGDSPLSVPVFADCFVVQSVDK